MASPTIIDTRTTMARKGWIKKAVPNSRKGVFAAKAAAAGKSTAEYAAEKASAPGTLGKEARLASTLMGMHHPDRAKKLYSNTKG